VKTCEIKIADWVWIERRHKIRVEQRISLFSNVRFIFVFLLLATISLFIFNHQIEVQGAASARLHQAAKNITTPDILRERALKHEAEVDQINEYSDSSD